MLFYSGLNGLQIFLLTCEFAGYLASTETGPPTVTTKYGKVEGLWKVSYGGREYASFEGIPFAKPPVGELRFEEPQPITPWNGVWKATKVNKCIQGSVHQKDITGDEDCLYLNIYVPQIKKHSNNLDVVVHIHGGGFLVGYGSEWTNEKYVMDRDVIFVTIHYRLGPLGFLSTEDSVVPGNNGLKDQTLALKWIKENIEAFGGNFESITITGFSAGAASVQFHYFSPLSRNLFHRGMSLSGAALHSFALQKNAAQKSKTLGEALGCATANTKAMIDCMKTRPAHLVLKMSLGVGHIHPLFALCDFNPVVEPVSKTAFLSEHPYILVKRGAIYDVPWIASSTTGEGLVFTLPISMSGQFEFFENNWTNYAKYFLFYDGLTPEGKETEIAEKIKNFYIPDGSIEETKIDNLTKMWTERAVAMDTMLAARMQAKSNKSPVYFYQFGYPSRFGFKALIGKSNFTGVAHGDDMPFFFGGMIVEPLTEEEIKLQNIALDALYSFAHNGKPTIPGVSWSSLSKDFNFLKINGPDDITMQIKTDYTSENFWNGLGLLEKENLFPDEGKSEL